MKKALVVTESKPFDIGYPTLCILPNGPKNGSKATKTELRDAGPPSIQTMEEHRYVLLVGNTPLQVVTGSAGIKSKRGTPFKRGKTIYLPMYSPGVLSHDLSKRGLLEADVRLFKEIIRGKGLPKESKLNPVTISTEKDLAQLPDLTGLASFDIETSCLYPWSPEAKIISLGFGMRDAQYLVPVNHPESPLKQEKVIAAMKKMRIKPITHNGKFDLLWTWVHFGFRWHNEFDTMLAHFMLDENSRHGLKELATRFCDAPNWDVGKDEKQGYGDLEDHLKYLAHDVYYTRKLKFIFGKMLNEDPEVKRVFEKLMMPLSNKFVAIEYDGVHVDYSRFKEVERKLRSDRSEAVKSLRRWQPDLDFNWGSTKQLSQLLYEDFGIEPLEYTKTGNPSCNKNVLKRIDHPCIDDLLKFKKAKQQLSFFIKGWKPWLDKRTDGYYLHPSFKLHGTVTGRFSCENPNLQQVPRDPLIRSLITAPPGWTFVSFDQSQAEMRVAAELSGDETLRRAFAEGLDTHWLTALREIQRGGGFQEEIQQIADRLSNRPLEYHEAIELMIERGPDACIEINSMWKEIRKKAKAVNFGYLFGMWWKKFLIYARDNYDLKLTEEQAQESREAFFNTYSGLEEWHERQRRYARRHGFVKTLTGRKRRLPEAKSSDRMTRQAAERQAINSPVQGFAKELTSMALVQLADEYGRDVVRICGDVHDAVLCIIKTERVPEVYARMLEIMERPKLMDEFGIKMSIPLKGDGEIGAWGTGVALEKWKC